MMGTKFCTLKSLLNARRASEVSVYGAFCFGIYHRWILTKNMMVVVMAVLACLVFVFSFSAYYFNMQRLARCLKNLWTGALFGLVAFMPMETVMKVEEAEVSLYIMNIFLIISIAMDVWKSAQLFYQNKTDDSLISSDTCLECLGVGILCLVSHNVIALVTLILAIMATLVTFRLHSYYSFVNVVILLLFSVSSVFSNLLHIHINGLVIATFLTRLFVQAIISIYFVEQSALNSWHRIIKLPLCVQRLLLIAFIMLQLAYFIVNCIQVTNHKEWFIVIPLFAAFSILWLSLRVVLFILIWKQAGLLSLSGYKTLALPETTRHGLNNILASDGLRHFALFSRRLLLVSFISSVVIFAFGWNTRSIISLALSFLILPLEAALFSLQNTLSQSLGDTYLAYALVIPAATTRTDGAPVLLASHSLQEINGRATRQLSAIQTFFAERLMDSYGSDFSSSGLSIDTLMTKLEAFMRRRTSQGTPYDTYVLYFSGPVHENGDWALEGDMRLSLPSLLSIWEKCMGTQARLVLVLDTPRSAHWLRALQSNRSLYVAIQSWWRTGDAESHLCAMEDFTSCWIEQSSDTNWPEFIQPCYAVSGGWTRFTMRWPTPDDMTHFSQENFPQFTQCVIQYAATPCPSENWCCSCSYMSSLFGQLRMQLCRPPVLDIGTSFSLYDVR